MQDKKENSPQKLDHSIDCCPEFDHSKFQEKTLEFRDKIFVKDKITSIFHFPLNFSSVMKRVGEKIELAKAMTKPEDYFYMTDESKLFGTPLFVEVTREVPGAENIKVSGKFLSKVFEGPYSNMGQFAKEMTGYVKSKGEMLQKLYFFYPYCPDCSKKYGKNYVVILAKVG